MVASGPLYKNFKVSGNTLNVTFDFIGSGLTSYDKELSAFEIAGADKKYIAAEAYIKNNKVYIYSSKIQNPKYARYAWKDTSVASLFNREGLPASTFTTE